MEKKIKITRGTRINELTDNEDLVEVLFEFGLGCVGCQFSEFDTIENGCEIHGFSDEEIDELVKKLNEISLKN